MIIITLLMLIKFLTKCMRSESMYMYNEMCPYESLHSNLSTFSTPHLHNFLKDSMIIFIKLDRLSSVKRLGRRIFSNPYLRI